MSLSSSMTCQSNRPTQTIVVIFLILSAVFVGVQYRATAPIADAAEPQVMTSTETDASLDSVPSIRRVRLSDATLRLQQKAKQVASNTVPAKTDPKTPKAEPSLDERQNESVNPIAPQSIRPDALREDTPNQWLSESDANAALDDPGTDDRPASDEQSDEQADEPAEPKPEPLSESVTIKPSLRISYPQASGDTVEIFVNQKVHEIQAGDQLNLPGEGPWTIQFMRGEQIVSQQASIRSGAYIVQPFGRSWQLKPVTQSN